MVLGRAIESYGDDMGQVKNRRADETCDLPFRPSNSTYSSGVRKTLLTFLSLIFCSVSLYGSKDQPCHETFQLKAEPIRRVYAKAEPITIRPEFHKFDFS